MASQAGFESETCCLGINGAGGAVSTTAAAVSSRALKLGKVALKTTTPSSPGVFKSTDSDDYIHVVMAMFVQR